MKEYSGRKKLYERPERLYLILAAVFSIVFMVIFTPWNSVDGPTHFMASYRYSNILMGIPEWSVRGNDQDVVYETLTDHSNAHMSEYYEFFCSDNTLKDDANSCKYMDFYGPFNYLPLIISIVIGRLFNLGIIPIGYLGRLISAAFYIFLFYHAIKTTPYGKHIFAFLALFPMTIHMITSFTYDSAVLAVCFNFFACLFRVIDSKKIEKDKTLFELLFWCAALGLIKGGAYAGLLLLLVVLFDKKNSWRKNLAVVLLIATGLIVLLCSNVFFNPSTEFFQLHRADANKFDFSFFFKHPGKYFVLWLNTVKAYCFPWLFEAIGTNAGYWQTFVLPSLPFVLLMLIPTFAAGYFGSADEKRLVNRKLLVITIVVSLLFLYITPATVLRDNLVTNTEIDYCTGRYFLPRYPLIFTVIVSLFSKPKKATHREWIVLGSYGVYAVLMCGVCVAFFKSFF
ncbi:MAG: DUF2142 domain-containing protein [Clostridiales bacterium]|nr:DUF2142 domain-containing protein [Clostridiales bacterium]MBR4947926.1 DUF2142 domain-containing protein [Clostridiales bacterium]